MTLTAGVISLVAAQGAAAQLTATAATGGTGPYTYQWYRSTTTGFTVGSGNLIAGATSLSLSDTGLTPNTIFYYKVVATDTGHSNDTIEYTQLAVTTTSGATQSQNQFTQGTQLGMIDERFDYNTIPVMIDVSQATTVFAGQLVKLVDSAGGVPKVVAITAETDDVWGALNYNIKNQGFAANTPCEMSADGNVIYLYATGAIARGAQVSPDLLTPGGIRAAAGHTGARVIGRAFDKATGYGQLIRVLMKTPTSVVV